MKANIAGDSDHDRQTTSLSMSKTPITHAYINTETRRTFSLSRMTSETVAGVCAGIVSTYVGHPLDTIKVRFQVC